MFKWYEEAKSIVERDPAARNVWQVIFQYPGYKAVRAYRKAHWFHKRGFYFIARAISQLARHRYGIEIHPGAKIGKGLFIDHGMGIVIGETTEIGDNVTIYKGATLGGTGKETGKRHPTIGNNVVISSGAKVLGPFKVGDNSKIGAGAVVLREVPPNCTVVGVPGRIVKRDNIPVGKSSGEAIDLDQVKLPDPVADALKRLTVRILELEEKIERLEAEEAKEQ